MKKLTVISLLLVFLFNTMGYYVVFKAEQWQVKNDIRSQIQSGLINDSRIAKITLKKSEISTMQFSDGGEEINYQNHMYDIVRTTETENTITYYCINDTQEESLFSSLDDHINTHVISNKPAKDQGAKKIIDTVVKVYFSTRSTFHFYPVTSKSVFIPENTIYLSIQKEISTPPPPEFC